MADEDATPVDPPVTEKTAEQIAAEQVVQTEQADIEARATRMGWTPKDKFRGDPAKWSDAKTYVDRGEQLLPVLRERYRALDDRFAKQEQAFVKTSGDLDEVKTRLEEATGALKEFREFSRKSEERAYTRAKAEIEAKMAVAAAAADTQTYHAAKAELDTLDRDRPKTEAPREPAREQARETTREAKPVQVDPEIPRWIDDNPWFNRDPIMNAFAVALNHKLLSEKPGLSMRDNLTEVKRIVMEKFPEKFENLRREAPAVVASPTAPASASRKKGKTFDDIPAADRKSFEEFKRWMPDYKPEDYAKQYFAGDE